MAEFPQIDSGLAVPVFKQGDDPIDAINKVMSFLSIVITSRCPSTNDQLRSSSNLRQQATIHDRRCPNLKRKRDATWFKDKVLLVEAQGKGKVLNEEDLEFLENPSVAEGLVTQSVITHNAAYQANDLDTTTNDFIKLKGKDIVDNAAQMSNATTMAPGLYKLGPIILTPHVKNNRDTHEYYLKHTMKQDAILKEVVQIVHWYLDSGCSKCMTRNRSQLMNFVSISHETSVAQTPQQNGVVERQNRTLVEAARTMLIYAKAPLFLWAEAVATACEPVDSIGAGASSTRTGEATLAGGEKNSSNTASVASPVLVEDAPAPIESTGSPSPITVDQDTPSPSTSQTTPQSQSQTIPLCDEEESHDLEVAHISNDPYFGIPIPKTVSKESSSLDVISTIVHSEAPISEHLIEPKTYKDVLTRLCWIEAMQEELHEFERLKVWKLVPRPDRVMVITLKWKYEVKSNELGGILKNKAGLVARGYRQEVGIDFEESFAPVARLEVVQIFLVFAAQMNMIVYQMDVKTAFLKGTVDPTLFINRKGKDILLGLWYSKDYAITLTAFVDADHAGGQDTRRSTSGRQVENGVIKLYFVRTEYLLADIFTKALCRERIKFLIDKLGMISFTLETLKELADEAEENMNPIATQQAALDNALVLSEKRLKIERCNARTAFSKPQKEETYQVTLESLKLSPCYPAFVITAEVPQIDMHQF
nr:hypothetical protein [Tanacetum cinerariifolium]